MDNGKELHDDSPLKTGHSIERKCISSCLYCENGKLKRDDFGNVLPISFPGSLNLNLYKFSTGAHYELPCFPLISEEEGYFDEPVVPNAVRTKSLGMFHVLPEMLLVRILKRLDEFSLKTCCLVSRVFCLFASDEELWKILCLKKRGGNFRFHGSWKRTTLFERDQVKSLPVFHLEVEGFFSPYLYQNWYRAHVNLSQWAKLPVNARLVERRSALSLVEFIEESNFPS